METNKVSVVCGPSERGPAFVITEFALDTSAYECVTKIFFAPDGADTVPESVEPKTVTWGLDYVSGEADVGINEGWAVDSYSVEGDESFSMPFNVWDAMQDLIIKETAE